MTSDFTIIHFIFLYTFCGVIIFLLLTYYEKFFEAEELSLRLGLILIWPLVAGMMLFIAGMMLFMCVGRCLEKADKRLPRRPNNDG